MENLTLGQISAAVLFLTAPGTSGGGFFMRGSVVRYAILLSNFLDRIGSGFDCSFDCSKCVKVQSSG